MATNYYPAGQTPQAMPGTGGTLPGVMAGASQQPGCSPSPNSKGVYVNNAFNRSVGRVGKPKGSHVISSKKTPSPATSTGRSARHSLNQSVTTPDSSQLQAPSPIANAHSRSCPNTSNQLQVYPQLQSINEAGVTVSQQPEQKTAENIDMQELTACMQNINSQFDEVDSRDRAIAFGDLQLDQQPIGCGGFGESYRAIWNGSRNPVAFKGLHYQGMSKKQREIFTDEATLLATLQHPNVVRVFGAVVEREKMGIVMEYLPNNLHYAIFVGGFPKEKKNKIIGQITEALQYLHTHSPPIAHGNISCRNVLLDENNNAKLSDFGFCTIKNATELFQRKIVRADYYSAPEVLCGKIFKSENQHFPADVYSLSIVVLEILSEEIPFDSLNIKQLEENVGRGNLRPELPTTLAQPIKDLLKRCWDADAAKRPTAFEFKCIWNGIAKPTVIAN